MARPISILGAALLLGCGGAIALDAGNDASVADASLSPEAASDATSLADAGLPDVFDAGPPVSDIVKCPVGIGPDAHAQGIEPGDGAVRLIPFDKSCSVEKDCAIGLHLYNCCGLLIALGVNVATIANFERDGGICGDEHGGLCDCGPLGTIAEDGHPSKRPGTSSSIASGASAGRASLPDDLRSYESALSTAASRSRLLNHVG